MFTTITWLLIAIILIIIKYGFIQPTSDKKMYELYKLRDELAISAMRKEVDQNTIEYEYIMDKINFSIYYTKNDYDFSTIIKNITCKTKKQMSIEKHIEELIYENNILLNFDRNINNLFVKGIYIRLLIFTNLIIKPFILLLSLMIKVLDVLESVLKIGNSLIKLLNKILKKTKRFEDNYKVYSENDIGLAMLKK